MKLIPSNIHFNISHSGDWVVCIFHEFPVGIDIEKVEAIDLSIANYYFSNEEWKDLMLLNVDKQLQYFYDIWTLKESYVKQIFLRVRIPRLLSLIAIASTERPLI